MTKPFSTAGPSDRIAWTDPTDSPRRSQAKGRLECLQRLGRPLRQDLQ